MEPFPSDRLLALALRVYSGLLLAYPAAFRRRFGTQMVQVFRDGYRDAGRRAGIAGLLRWWLGTLLDLGRTAVGERLAERARRRQRMQEGARAFVGQTAQATGTGRAGAVNAGAGRSLGRALLRLIGLGLLWDGLVQGFRDYGGGIPILGHLDFVWLEVLALVLLLGGLAFRAPGWSPAAAGLLVAVFCTSVLVGHYGYYAAALALGQGHAHRVDVDLADPQSYRFLFDVWTGGIARWLLGVELGGFAAGWAWALLLRRLRPWRGPATVRGA